MKKLLIIFLFFTKTGFAQSFVIDTADIIQHQLIFDTSNLFQNEDMFVMQNIIFELSRYEADIIKDSFCCYGKSSSIQFISKKKFKLKIEKLIINKTIYGKKDGFPFIRIGNKFDLIYEWYWPVLVKLKNDINLYNETAVTDVTLFYSINGKHKKIKVNEVKVIDNTYLIHNYYKERLGNWRYTYKQFK